MKVNDPIFLRIDSPSVPERRASIQQADSASSNQEPNKSAKIPNESDAHHRQSSAKALEISVDERARSVVMVVKDTHSGETVVQVPVIRRVMTEESDVKPRGLAVNKYV